MKTLFGGGQGRFRWLAVPTGLFLMASSVAETVVTYRAAESVVDVRYDYDAAVLRLALEKTRTRYGAYRLHPSAPMNAPRAMAVLADNQIPGLVVKLSFHDRLMEGGKFAFSNFPVDYGIVGYRTCFVSPRAREAVTRASTLDELRQFSMGLGKGWADVDILRHNGFKVIEVQTYESLFEMVANNRFDLFCRGINEVHQELAAHRHLPGLVLDESIALAYPLPRFFFTHTSDATLARRIEEGLRTAHADGSLKTLWREFYGESLELARLEKRRVFKLSNPHLRQLDVDPPAALPALADQHGKPSEKAQKKP